MTHLSARGIVASAATKQILRGVDFDLAPGSLNVLLGPSGCGKTTLLRALAGLQLIDSGTVTADADDITAWPPERRRLVLMHQEDTLFPHLDAAANIEFPLRIRGRGRAERSARALELLALVGLEGFGARSPDQLSGGERQRVALARALAAGPRVLLLDEPFSALDRPLRQTLRADLRRILRSLGVTALFVTHDRDEALTLADRLFVMDAGRMVDAGDPRRVFDAPANAATARALGRRNLLDAQPLRDGLVTALGELPMAPEHAASRLLMVPEDAWTLTGPEAGGPVGVVEELGFVGSHTLVSVRVGRQLLVVDQAGAPSAAVGDTVGLSWPPTRVHPFPPSGQTPQS